MVVDVSKPINPPGNTLVNFLALLAYGAGFFAVIEYFTGIAQADSAPKQAAVAAMSLAIAVLPYVIFKVCWCRRLLKEQEQANALLRELITVAKSE